LRGLREYPVEKPAGERRVVVLGDSFTFGENVGDEQTYAFRLERLLEGASVLNFGVHGYGTDQQYLLLKERGFAYGPDVVILGFYEEDATRNVLAFRDYAKPVFRFRGQDLELTNVPVPPPEQLRLNVPSRFSPRLFRFLGVQAQALQRSFFSKKEEAPELRVSLAILDLLRRDCLERKVALLLLIIPVQV